MYNINEIWKAIPGYDGYEVSNLGRVRSFRIRGGYRHDPLVLRPAKQKGGYLGVNLRQNGLSIFRRVHQLVLEAFIGPKPEGYHGAHLNGKPGDNRLQNLRWVTAAENMRHKKIHGTENILSGMDAPNRILDESEVIAIKTRINKGERWQDVAQDYPHVNPFTVRAIASGKTWNSVGPQMKQYQPRHKHLSMYQQMAMVDAILEGKTVTEVAQETGYNVATVSRTFERLTGQSIRQFKRAWTEQARELSKVGELV